MIEEELLRPTESKQESAKEEPAASPISIDNNRVQALIKVRQEKLAAVRSFISLKLYDQIAEKLEQEAKSLTTEIKQKVVEAAKQNREQSLPKAFFEQRYLKIKSIRID